MKIVSYIEKILKIISFILFASLVSVVSFQIISRISTGTSFVMIEELSMFLLAWCTFLCTAYTARKKAHVKVEYFVNKFLSTKQSQWLDIVLHGSLIIILCIVTVHAFSFVQRQMKIKMVILPISKGLMYLSFPVGMIFLIIFLLDDLCNLIRLIRSVNEIKQKRANLT